MSTFGIGTTSLRYMNLFIDEGDLVTESIKIEGNDTQTKGKKFESPLGFSLKTRLIHITTDSQLMGT